MLASDTCLLPCESHVTIMHPDVHPWFARCRSQNLRNTPAYVYVRESSPVHHIAYQCSTIQASSEIGDQHAFRGVSSSPSVRSCVVFPSCGLAFPDTSSCLLSGSRDFHRKSPGSMDDDNCGYIKSLPDLSPSYFRTIGRIIDPRCDNSALSLPVPTHRVTHPCDS